jgi:hypothetical protein
MKKYISILVIIVIIGLVGWYAATRSYINPSKVSNTPESGILETVYSNDTIGFSLRLPSLASSSIENADRYTIDELHMYQASPSKKIYGVKFTIPKSLATGTNLGSDSYISIESIPNTKSCTANLFLDGTNPVIEKIDGGFVYSFSEASGAGAGNRYEETIYALLGTNPCIAVRYFVHYGVPQNYPEGSIMEFDKAALVDQFDQIRKTLVINQ